MVRRAEVAQPRVRLARDTAAYLRRQARLADPWLPGDRHNPPLAVLCLLPAAEQQVEFFITSDKRYGVRSQCLETAQDTALAEHAPGVLRFGKPGETLRPQIFDLEQSADLPARALGNDERVGLGQSLQPGGEVRRLADDPALLRGTGAD